MSLSVTGVISCDLKRHPSRPSLWSDLLSFSCWRVWLIKRPLIKRRRQLLNFRVYSLTADPGCPRRSLAINKCCFRASQRFLMKQRRLCHGAVFSLGGQKKKKKSRVYCRHKAGRNAREMRQLVKNFITAVKRKQLRSFLITNSWF